MQRHWDLHAVEMSQVGAWRIMGMPAYPGNCTARIDSKDVDLIIMFNNVDKVVMMAGHPGWKPMAGWPGGHLVDVIGL